MLTTTTPITKPDKPKTVQLNAPPKRGAKVGPIPSGTDLSKARVKSQISTMSRFMSDWKGQTINEVFILFDPDDKTQAKIRSTVDRAMFLHIFILALVVINWNVGLYILIELGSTWAGHHARLIFNEGSQYFVGIWLWIFSPVPSTFLSIACQALHREGKQSKAKLMLFLITRYVILTCPILYLTFAICFWSQRITRVDRIKDPMWNSFREYANGTDPVIRKVWENTQQSFDCCGMNSYMDFNNSILIENLRGLVYCATKDCSMTLSKPIIKQAYPLTCCDSTTELRCVTNPMSDQVWKIGCAQRQVYWIQSILRIIICVTFGIIVFIFVNTALFIRIDVLTCEYYSKPRKKLFSLGPTILPPIIPQIKIERVNDQKGQPLKDMPASEEPLNINTIV